MNRTRRFLGGAGLGYVNQIVITLVGVWLTRFLLARLGAHDYGLWLVALQIFGFLLLADLGVVALLPRETAYARGRTEPVPAGDIQEITGLTVRLVLWQLPLVALAAVGVWVWLPDSWEPLRQPLAPVLVAFVAFFPLRVLPALLQGLQDLAYAGWAQLLAWAVTTATSVGMVLQGEGLSALAVGWIAGQLALAAMCWFRLRLRHPEVLPEDLPRLSWATAWEYMSKSVWVSVAQVSQVLLSGSDILIIGAALGPAAVLPYVCTSKMLSVVRNQPLIFLQSAVPGLSEMRVAEPRERLQQVTTALMQGTLILSGVVACLVLPSNEWFVGWWVGPGNYGGLWLTTALVASMIVRHAASTLVFSLFAFGYERRLAWVGLADGLATIVGTVALVHLLGSVGAPLASVASACLVSLPLILGTYSRVTGLSVRDSLRPIWPWCIRFGVVLAPAVGIAAVRPPETLLTTAVLTAATSLMYALLLTPLLGRDPLARYVPRRVASIVARLFPRQIPVQT